MHPEFDRIDLVEYRLNQVKPWLHSSQKNGRIITGKDLYRHIRDGNILPSCFSFRDLEEIQKLGTEVFRKYFCGKVIFAWKDVIEDRVGRLLVPCLCESGAEVVVDWRWLDYDWDDRSPALRHAI